MSGTPSQVQTILAEIAKDPIMNDGMEAMMERSSEFATPLAAKLTGAFLNPAGRTHYEKGLDEMWADTSIPREVPEIVVGGGLHAAIYCAVRVHEGHPKPLVIEAQERVGGTFAVSHDASFFLNSRNRPGNLGIPGREEALNVLPGAPVQPADLSGDEYQPNSSLAFSIRSALAMYARVLVGHEVRAADSTSVTLATGKKIKTTRVVYATGLGKPNAPEGGIDGKYAMDYMQFLSHMDSKFPFHGIKRVAVVGANDSGRTVIEALVGQGPTSRLSVASLDFVESIDWYGVPEGCSTRKSWRENNRSRYQGIARVLPTKRVGENRTLSEDGRVSPINRKADVAGIGFDGAYIDGARYDLVIWATGFTPQLDVSDWSVYKAGGREVARMEESSVFAIGPASQITDTPEANVPETVPENAAAVFRYADRTAALAKHLPAYGFPGVEIEGEVETDPAQDDPAARVGVFAVPVSLAPTPIQFDKGVEKGVEARNPFTAVLKEKVEAEERTVKGKNRKPYKVGDLIAKKGYQTGRSYYTRKEMRAKVLAITGPKNKPRVKVRQTQGYDRFTETISDPKQWQKVERGKRIDGKPVPNY